jgi:hypothetical protein
LVLITSDWSTLNLLFAGFTASNSKGKLLGCRGGFQLPLQLMNMSLGTAVES